MLSVKREKRKLWGKYGRIWRCIGHQGWREEENWPTGCESGRTGLVSSEMEEEIGMRKEFELKKSNRGTAQQDEFRWIMSYGDGTLTLWLWVMYVVLLHLELLLKMAPTSWPRWQDEKGILSRITVVSLEIMSNGLCLQRIHCSCSLGTKGNFSFDQGMALFHRAGRAVLVFRAQWSGHRGTGQGLSMSVCVCREECGCLCGMYICFTF